MAARMTTLAHNKPETDDSFDDDDVATPNGLGALVNALDRSPEAGFAYGSFRWVCVVLRDSSAAFDWLRLHPMR